MITSVERKTNLPVSLVFAAFTNLDLRKKIIPNVKEIKVIKHNNQLQYGSVWEEYRMWYLKKSKTTYTVVIFEKNELFAIDYDEPGIRYRIEYHFIVNDDGSLIKIIHEGIPVTTKGRLKYFIKKQLNFFLRKKLNNEISTLIKHLEQDEKNNQ